MSFRSRIAGIITKVFGLEEGEMEKAFILQFILFLLINTLLLLKPTVNSLFLSALTADALPLAYMVTAILAALGAKFYDISLEKFKLNSIVLHTLYGTVIMILFFALTFYYKVDSPFILYTIYVFVAIYGLLVTSQFWLMTNVVYNIRQAKRVFGFIGAGGIAGGITGGYLTSILAHLMPSEYILFVAAFLVLCCVPLYQYFWKRESNRGGIISRHKEEDNKEKGRTPFYFIKNSKLLAYITIVTGLSVLIAKLIDYQYSDYATRYMESTEDLSSFFGIWLSNISIISLLIQLFLTERILKYFGVGSTLLIMPAGILLGSIVLLVLPELWVVVFIKVVDGSFKQSVNKSAKELIFMPVPYEAKKKTKTFIDVVVDSVATGIAGIILFFFIEAFDVSSTYVSIIIIAMLALEIQMIFRLKGAYRESFRVLANPPPVKGSITPAKNKNKAPLTSIPDTVAWIFQNGTEPQILHMLQRTFEYPDKRFIGPLRGLLSHESAQVRTMAIKNLYHMRSVDLSESMEKMAFDRNPVTATQAMRYIFNRRSAGRKEIFENYFYDKSPFVSNAALVAFAKELRSNSRLQKKYKFEAYIKQAVNLWQQEEGEIKHLRLMAVLLSIGHARVKNYYKLLEEELTSKDDRTLYVALQAAGRTTDFRFLDLIVAQLSEKPFRKHVEFTLFKYGEAVIPELKRRVFEGIKDFHDSIFVPEVIEKFQNEKAVRALIDLAEKGDHTVAISSIKSLIRLQQSTSLKVGNNFLIRNVKRECRKYKNIVAIIHSLSRLNEQVDTSFPEFAEEKEARAGLLSLLKQWLDKPNQRLIYLLNLKYPIEDLEPMAHVLVKGELDDKINAAEFLENKFSFELRRSLMPIIESRLVKSEHKYDAMFESLNGEDLSENECIRILLSQNNIKLRHACLYLISKLKDPRYMPLVKEHFNDFHLKIQEHAKQTHAVLKLQKVRT